MLSGLRLSFRIARREAWRHRRRSALSIALLTLPLFAVSFGASAWDTTELTDYQRMQQLIGGADAYLELQTRGPIEQRTWDSLYPWTEWDDVYQDWDADVSAEEDAAAILAVLPEGSRAAPFSFDYMPFGESIRFTGHRHLHDIDALPYDLTDPLYELADVRVSEGRPAGPGEVVLSRAIARATGYRVGDTAEIKHRGETVVYTVVGVLERPDNLAAEFIVGPDFEHDATEFEWIVDVPGEFTLEHAKALNAIGFAVIAPSLAPDRGTQPQLGTPDADGIAVLALLITLIVLEVVLLSGPAFAISVKQRTREFALISAIGATPAQLRRIVLAGGALFGAIAAVLGIGLGVLAAYLSLPLLERLVNHRSSGFEVWPAFQLIVVVAAVVTGLLAALAAAIAASRVNVVAALAGRRPVQRIRRHWLLIGLAVVVLGGATGVVGILTMTTIPMVIGIASLQLGLVACTPSLISGVSRLGRRLWLAPRMALRETGRNRSAAAPAVAAIMAVVAGGIAITMYAVAEYHRYQWDRPAPTGVVELSVYGAQEWGTWEWITDAEAFAGDVAGALAIAERVLDDPKVHRIESFGLCAPDPADEPEYCSLEVVRPPDRVCPYDSDEPISSAQQRAAVEHPYCTADNQWQGYWSYMIATSDPELVSIYTGLEGPALDAAIAVLRDGGVLVGDPLAIRSDGTVVIERTVEDERRRIVDEFTFPALAPESEKLGGDSVLLSPGAMEALGAGDEPYSATFLLIPERTATQRQVDEITEALAEAGFDGGGGAPSAWVSVVNDQDLTTLYISVVAAILTGTVALGATAVATGLVITETRRDLTTLGAVGAAPGMRRRLSMWQAAVISLLGAGLGAAVGLASYAAIAAAMNANLRWAYPIERPLDYSVPWLNLAIALVAVPAIAMFGAALATRSELPAERRLS